MRVLVCGVRYYKNAKMVYETLDRIGAAMIIQGGATGADKLASDWAQDHFVSQRVFLAHWEEHGKAAGPIRNQQMIDEGKPDLVVAFPGGKGTADMVRRARVAGLSVIEVTK